MRKRIGAEVGNAIAYSKIEEFVLTVIDFDNVKVSFMAPETSVYKGLTINIYIRFPMDYPFKAPRIIFDPIIFHPNVTEEGYTFFFYRIWSPAYTIRRIVRQVRYLLEHPNKEDPDIFQRYLIDDRDSKGKEEMQEIHNGANYLLDDQIIENQLAMDMWDNKEFLREMTHSF